MVVGVLMGLGRRDRPTSSTFSHLLPHSTINYNQAELDTSPTGSWNYGVWITGQCAELHMFELKTGG